MRILVLAVIALVFTSCVSTRPAPSVEESARFNQHIDEQFERMLALSPQALTNFGRKDRNSELNDYSDAFDLKILNIRKEQLRGLDAFNRSVMDTQTQLTYDLFKKSLTEEIEDFQWKDYQYIVTQHGGLHSDLPVFMINKHKVDNEKDLRDYIARLNEFKRVFSEANTRLQKSEAMGIIPPKFVFAPVLESARNIIKGAPFENGKPSPLLADFNDKLKKLKLPSKTNKELTEMAKSALLESVKPAYTSLIKTVQSLATRANTDDGAWKFPRGEEFYQVRLKRYTTTNMSSDQIHELGLDNVARLRQDMLAIQKRLGIAGDLPTFFKIMQNDPKQYFPNTDIGRAQYLKLASDYRDFVMSRINQYMWTLPKTPFEIRAVEKFREKSAGKAFYDRPSDDGTRPGVYYVNLRNMKDVPKFEAEALLYHEGIPGHHFQIATAIEKKELPKFRRYGRYTAYSEGWGLYTERLGKDMGGYTNDYSELGRLSMEMLRACRLVVDTGIHAKRWTREKALRFVGENLPVSEGSQTEQIERYIVMPGQATAYMVGMLKIWNLREGARSRLGKKFDIRDFHKVVLENGPIPLDILENLVETYEQSTMKL